MLSSPFRTSRREPPIETTRPSPHLWLYRVLAAFVVSLAMLSVSLVRKAPDFGSKTLLDEVSWLVCAALVGWNALEYAFGRAAHGHETPPWLRWVLSIPYFLVMTIAVRTLAAMIASIAYLAGAGG